MCLIASLYNYIENESQHESGQGQDRLHYGPGLQCLGYRHVKEFFYHPEAGIVHVGQYDGACSGSEHH